MCILELENEKLDFEIWRLQKSVSNFEMANEYGFTKKHNH